MANMYHFLFLVVCISQVWCVEWAPGPDLSHERTRRNVGAAAPSADDRPSCKAGATKPSTQVDTTARLQNLRLEMTNLGIQAYIIPSEDAHQSEYPAYYDRRRGFITGFSGSAGRAVVLGTKAAMWTDGRYFLEAENTLDCNWILMKSGVDGVPTITEWLKSELAANQKVGASPFLMSSSTWEDYRKELLKSSINMEKVDNELIDRIWTQNRPAQPDTPINALEIKYAGRSWQDKIMDMHKRMEEEEVSVLVITGLDETAWLFNLRADDIAYNPFFLSYAIVERDNNRTRLYIKSHATKLTQQPTDSDTRQNLQSHLNTNTDGSCGGKTGLCVQVLEYSGATVVSNVNALTGRTWIAHNCNFAIYSAIPEIRIYQANTPAAVQKSQKNDVEIMGMKNSHIRDAVAVIRFAAKIEKEVKEGKEWTEVSAAAELDSYRRELQYNRGLSFNTISASGSNGAVIHYSPANITNNKLTTSDMYLLDSGGQYLDGTTDITRTFHFGTPKAFEKESYTRVLMGQIDLALAVWPKGLYGREIDAFARKPLWDVGLVYRHGTGHGIGAYLSVHEGPGRISLSHRPFIQDTPLMAHQFYSDEPGYYQDGEFGVRLETIVMVKNVETKYQFPDTQFLGFEPVTLVPYEPHLIDNTMLNQKQIDWLNSYHKQCLDKVGPKVQETGDTAAYKWLQERTKVYSLTTSRAVITQTGHFLLILCALILSACILR